MATGKLRFIRGVLLVGLLLGWGNAQGIEINYAALMEKHGLSPGMKITKENADLIKNLVPNVVYERTKNGEYLFTIGKFESPDLLTKIWDQEFYEASKQSAGKYDVDEDGGIIDKATGKRPWPMPLGLPFPNLDLTESPKKVGTKIFWNVVALAPTCNEQDHHGARLGSMPIHGTMERYLSLKQLRQYIDFRRTPVQIDRPVIFQEIQFISEPADAFGTANLTWRWSDPKKWDSVWGFSPSTRRVRRLTAANRSDAVLGTEFVQDDGTPSYNGKLEMMEWKYIGKGEALLPVYLQEDQAPDDYVAKLTYKAAPSSYYTKSPGAYQQQYKKVMAGFMENPQQHASYWTLSLLWIPVPVYIVEGVPKDSYYNYGRMIFWLEQASFTPTWKQVYNRSGEYWRTNLLFFEYPRFNVGGKEQVCFDGVGASFIDDKNNRGTIGADTGDNLIGKRGGPSVSYNTGLGSEAFDLSRFLEYGK